MKRIIYFILALFVAITINAQEDRFTDYSQIENKEVILYDLQSVLLSNGKFIFRQDGDKLKAIPPKLVAQWGDHLKLECQEFITVKKKKYIKCKNDHYGEIFLLVSPEKRYVDKLRNISFWEAYISKLTESYPYIYIEDAACERNIDKYKKVEWLNAKISDKSIEDEVTLTYKISNDNKINDISYRELNEEKSHAFKSAEEYNIEAIEQQRLDSIQEAKDRKNDTIIVAAECIIEHEYNNGEEDNKISVGDSIYVYYIGKEKMKMKGWYLHNQVTVRMNHFYIENKDNVNFLAYRGEKNIAFRDSIAKEESKKYARRYLIRLGEELDRLEKAVKERIKKIKAEQLFYKENKYEFGEYSDFGMKYVIHNCWNKTINYIEFTSTAYNAIGDIQGDWVGKYQAKTKGIGPLEPGESASWAWDNMFYDKNDVISRVKLTRIKFIFSDGTSKVFSGSENINKHRW